MPSGTSCLLAMGLVSWSQRPMTVFPGGGQPLDTRSFLEARVGTVLAGRWVLDELLGIGGCAAVYSATHRNGRRFAIKIAHPDQLRSAQDLERFRREPYLANRLEHPAVVRVFDDGTTEDGLPFFVMELLEGEPIGVSVHRGEPRTFADVIDIVRTVLSVLEVAHAQGIVHRDLKPSNFFRCTTGELKLLDFGIARAVDLDELTQSGVMLGTPAFMSPEQALARRDLVGPPTDVFAVGASALVLLKGGPLRQGNELALAAIEPLPSAEELGLRGPREVLRVFERAVAFHVDARFPSAYAMRVALEQAVSALPPHALNVTAALPPSQLDPSADRTVRDAVGERLRDDHLDLVHPETAAFVLDRRTSVPPPASGTRSVPPPASASGERRAEKQASTEWIRLLAAVLMVLGAGLAVRWVLVHRTKPHAP